MIDHLTSFPPCPECNHFPLTLRKMPDYGETHWFCSECDTQWTVEDLIEALNQNVELATVLAMQELDEMEEEQKQERREAESNQEGEL